MNKKITDGLNGDFVVPATWRSYSESSTNVYSEGNKRVSRDRIKYRDSEGNEHAVERYELYEVLEEYDDHDAGLGGEYATLKIGCRKLY